MKIFGLIIGCLIGGMVHAQNNAVVEEKASEWIMVPPYQSTAKKTVPAKKTVARKKTSTVASRKKPVSTEKQPAAFDRTNDKVNRFRKPKQ